MDKLILTDRNGVDYEVKNPQRFSYHIFRVRVSGSSIHEEEGHYFVVNDELREIILNLLYENN